MRIFGLLILLLLGCTPAPATLPDKDKAAKGAGADKQDKTDKQDKPEKVQPYDKVIPKEAVTKAGLFKVHVVENRHYFEIPKEALGKEMLWVTQIERIQAGAGLGGTPARRGVVRWEVRHEDVLLREVRYDLRADAADPILRAVQASSLEPVLARLPVKAWAPSGAAVVEVGPFLLEDLPFSVKRPLKAGEPDKGRSFVESVRPFPTNVESKVLATFKAKPGKADADGDDDHGGAERSTITALLHHSMVLLPDSLMTPRRLDARVGYFSVAHDDFSSDQHLAETVRHIVRWRLEKRDPKAAVSEPVKPIVYYVGREVPALWRPWVRKGIEAWQPVFEAAGFRNAILAKEPPTAEEDPDWDAEDARYSVVRWLSSTVENAMGPHVHDPRTGEILEADILMHHNVLKLARDWYFVQASPNDPRAQAFPFAPELLGELLAYIVSHEVGHTLGFPHNMKASSSYTVEQLRDPAFTRKNGTEASIMDYGRFNYVAQPGDGAALIPIIGPYDYFALDWGYREFTEVTTPSAVKALLEMIVARQKDDPVLRFGDRGPEEDPTRQTEDLGSDPVRATELGLKNIDRVAGFLVKATCKEGEDYSLLRNMYDQLVAQRARELGHVASVVGGVERIELWYGHADKVYHPVSAERQREAVAFLAKHAFRNPASLLDPDVLSRLEADGAGDRLLQSQKRLLATLMSADRVRRMAEVGGDYKPAELFADLRKAAWEELTARPPVVDLQRRNLQRVHLELLIAALGEKGPPSDLPALARWELKELRTLVAGAAGTTIDPVTRAHFENSVARIEAAFDPSK